MRFFFRMFFKVDSFLLMLNSFYFSYRMFSLGNIQEPPNERPYGLFILHYAC
jgi:hypothetical protein